MKQFRFILLCATIGVMTAGLTGCTKSVYDEKQALEAQQGLLQFKYAEETKLELLRQSGASALEQLKYQFGVRTMAAGDSIKDAALRKRDIVIYVIEPLAIKPLAGATVTIPTLIGTVLTATTDSLGLAYFPAAKNVNVPYPASVTVSKKGYSTGTVIQGIYGTSTALLDILAAGGTKINPNQLDGLGPNSGFRTVYLINTSNTNNIVKGKVYIESDLTNNTSEYAANALVSIYSSYNIYNDEIPQIIEWSTLTDKDGNYEFKIPDLIYPLIFNFSTYETNSTLYVNGTLPGKDELPSVKSIPATYYIAPYAPGFDLPENNVASISVPTSIFRFHAVTPSADSLGNKFYIRPLTLTTGADLTNSTKAVSVATINLSPGSIFAPTAPTTYKADGTATASTAVPRYIATKALVDTAVFYDALGNADNYIKKAPVLEFNYNLDLDAAGNKSVSLNNLTQKTAGVLNNVNGAEYKTTQELTNRAFTYSISYDNYNYYASRFYYYYFNFNGTYLIENVNGGKTYTKNLTYGVGKLKTTVR